MDRHYIWTDDSGEISPEVWARLAKFFQQKQREIEGEECPICHGTGRVHIVEEKAR